MDEQMAELRAEMAQIRQEMLQHREVLQNCLEVRESVMELLTHRDELVECLELREGVQAVLGSARIIHDMGEKSAELDLTLAGVSDNIARHGKAISSLVEQQKSTTSIVDAVVRAVKRLDLRRIGHGGRSEIVDHAYGIHTGLSFGAAMPAVASNGAVRGLGVRSLREVTQRPPSGGSNMWERLSDDGFDTGGYSDARDEPPYCSRSSSCGSEPLPWHPTSHQQHHQPLGSGPLGAPTEFASCVDGVLARIEEALMKLDGSGEAEADAALAGAAARCGRARSGGASARGGGGVSARPPPPSTAPPPPDHPRTRGLAATSLAN